VSLGVVASDASRSSRRAVAAAGLRQPARRREGSRLARSLAQHAVGAVAFWYGE